MPINDFIGFASSGAANVMSQADYAAAAEQTNGVQPGPASSSLANKVWRQGSNMSSALGMLITAYGYDALDDGDIAALSNNLKKTIASIYDVKNASYTLSAGVDTVHSHYPSNPFTCIQVGPIVVFNFDLAFTSALSSWGAAYIATGMPQAQKNVLFSNLVADNLYVDAWYSISTNGDLMINTRAISIPAEKAIVGGGVYIATD